MCPCPRCLGNIHGGGDRIGREEGESPQKTLSTDAVDERVSA